MNNNNYEFRLLKITKSDHTDQVTITAQVRLPITHIGEQITQTIYREDANKILKAGINSQRAGITTDIYGRVNNLIEPDLITINDLQNLDKTVLYEQLPNQRNAVLFQAQLLDSNKEDNYVHHDQFWPPPIVSY